MMISAIKQHVIQTSKLLWSFKWSVLIYWFYIGAHIAALFDVPAENSPIYNAEAISGDWKYTNPDVYLGCMELKLFNIGLIFLLAVAYMPKHSFLARLLLLLPVFYDITATFVNYN